MRVPTPKCELCGFYALARDGEQLGECRRSAPTAGNGWPRVNADDWCADWAGTDGEGWVTWHMRKMRESLT
jgi:hypothetical protein